MSRLAGSGGMGAIARGFALTLVPIAIAYHLAHYLVYLLTQGQYVIPLASDPFGCYLAFGITAMFGFQALVNIGVVLGSLPTKGLPLPFISYGGTALVMSLFTAGVLANISARNPEPGDWVFPGARRGGLKGANRRVDSGPRIVVEVGDRPLNETSTPAIGADG